ncbi:MAG: beta-N-acetylhexosaminidase [Mucilaginibacter sp.]|nr:beta-N-acetylhexosaminidase [Mucilaginibacter sp.]
MFNRLFLLLCVCIAATSGAANAQEVNPNLGIIPAPVSIKTTTGAFILSRQTTLLADSTTNKAVLFLADYLKNTAMLRVVLKPNNGTATANSLVLTGKGADNLPAEGYRLTITPRRIIIAGKGAGLFYGVQTLIQLMPSERGATAKLACVQIEDYPRFGYRGVMLDVSRHFFSVEFVKKYIDLMAAYKINNFHWHLTDDQGWRIEIKKYPKLTQIGSRRAQTLIGGYYDRMPQQFDNTPYGGYYTQDEVRDVIKYAADRYINIVPEIEMPGHSLAALAAYPELSCDAGKTYKVAETWGIFTDVYCPSEKTFGFLEDVLTEVINLFPSKYIHIGGDEVPKEAWKQSAFCQNLIKQLKLKDENELQSYFTQRIEKFVNSKGRSIIGWDEILEGGLSPHATVMSWRGEEGGIAAAQQNHDVIMTPINQGMYISTPEEKLQDNAGQYVTLKRTYSYNPVPAALTPEQQKRIIGIQACMWAEQLNSDIKAEHLLLPRMLAMAETGWTPLAKKNYEDFADKRLPRHLAMFDRQGLEYYVPGAIGATDTIMFGDQLHVNLKSSVAGAKVYYTIDGTAPDETAIEYTRPMVYNIPEGQYRELKTIVITPAGKRSQVTRAIKYNNAPLKPVSFNSTVTGVKYYLSRGTFSSTAQLDRAAVVDSGIVKDINVPDLKKNNPAFGVTYTGFIHIETDGDYRFSTLSANGSVLLIDGLPVVDNDGKHRLYEESGTIPLQKGFHKLTVKYFNSGGRGSLKLFETSPGKEKAEITAGMLFN